METCRGLPAPEVCKIERFISSADYWICKVDEPAPCQYVVFIGTVQLCSMASRSCAWLKSKIEGRKVAVRYADSSSGIVSKAMLDNLIESGRVSAFRRSTGWVDIVKDPIRQKSSPSLFRGLQRRDSRKSGGSELPLDTLKR